MARRIGSQTASATGTPSTTLLFPSVFPPPGRSSSPPPEPSSHAVRTGRSVACGSNEDSGESVFDEGSAEASVGL
ncbi:MAG: hypothetical protein LBK22_00945 [Tannerella sp.]|nr:hypothetical protein [Tannerella sp.]